MWGAGGGGGCKDTWAGEVSPLYVQCVVYVHSIRG